MFEGKVAVVTGAASGIGEAFARLYVERGGAVVVADINVERGERLAAELGAAAIFLRTDVTSEADVANAVVTAVYRWGRLDCMVNNAGAIGALGSIRDLERDEWRRTTALLLDSVFFGIKHAARAMVAQEHGCILSVASIAGLTGGAAPHAYTTAKHGVVGLTRSAAAELAKYGVRVNAVAPGRTVTPLVVERVGHDLEKAIAVAARTSPLARAILPEDIAEALAYLASDAARNVSAHVLVVDGGKIMTEVAGHAPPA